MVRASQPSTSRPGGILAARGPMPKGDPAREAIDRNLPSLLLGMQTLLTGGRAEGVLRYWQTLSGYLWLSGRYFEYAQCVATRS